MSSLLTIELFFVTANPDYLNTPGTAAGALKIEAKSFPSLLVSPSAI